MNIFKHEFKQKTKSMFIWTLCIMIWVMIIVAFIPSMVELGEEFAGILADMGAFAEVLNINADTFSTVLGIIGMYFGMLLIVFGIQAANYGFGLVSIEESELTADFLITKPVKRTKIMTSKILATFAVFLITNIIYVGVTYGSVMAISKEMVVDKKALILVLVSALFVQLFFFAIGLLISLFLKKVKSVTPFSMSIVFGMYILSAFARSFEIEFLEYINPFSYFDSAMIADKGEYNMVFFIINLAIVVVAITVSYILYKKRDIKSI